MPAGPLGWICQMRREPGCEFELVAQELVPAELGSGPWIGPMLPRRVGGVAPFRLHLSLLLPPGGGFWGVGGWGVVAGAWRGRGEGEGVVGCEVPAKGGGGKGSGGRRVLTSA